MERNPTLNCGLIHLLMLLAICTSHSLVQPKELRRKAVCGDDILYLDCGNTSIIAIHEAAFTSNVTQHENITCSAQDESSEPDVNGACVEDVRNEINKRCSGLKECNFSYGQIAERNCDERWGSLVIRYDCARESSINRFCNVRIHSKEGYVASPAYPQYYPRLPNCNWTLETGDGQTVTLRLLHVHLPCDDTLSVLEGNTRRLHVCGEGLKPLKTLEVEGNNGIVVQFTSDEFRPASGFLLYYKVKGCSTLPPPSEGYLLQRNGSSAVYICCQKHVFNDTQEPTRTLQCVGDRRWNDSLVSCVPAEELRQVYVNRSMDADFENLTTEEMVPKVSEARSSYMEDILIPSILMATLVVGNAVIVCIIMRIRRKQKSKLEVEEDDDLSPQTPLPLTRDATEV